MRAGKRSPARVRPDRRRSRGPGVAGPPPGFCSLGSTQSARWSGRWGEQLGSLLRCSRHRRSGFAGTSPPVPLAPRAVTRNEEPGNGRSVPLGWPLPSAQREPREWFARTRARFEARNVTNGRGRRRGAPREDSRSVFGWHGKGLPIGLQVAFLEQFVRFIKNTKKFCSRLFAEATPLPQDVNFCWKGNQPETRHETPQTTSPSRFRQAFP